MLHGFSEDDDASSRLYSAAGLVRLATSMCGGPVPFDPAGQSGFEQLCDAFELARPGQTTFGKLFARSVLLDGLIKRYRLADYIRRFPAVESIDLPSPVFIVAPFRTGTTFLHRLLSCDPQNRCPRMWEVAYPPPAEPYLRGDARYFAHDARIAKAAAALRTLHRASPALCRLHPMAPDLAEECFGLLETSFLSHSFMFYAGLPSYLDWLDARETDDWRAAYTLYAAQLRLLHWWQPGRRWILKSPVHQWNLGMVLEFFPRSHIIQLRRDPVDAMDSFCRLLTEYRRLMCRSVDPVAIGRQAETYARKAFDRAVAARRRTETPRFIDVEFNELLGDPMACVQAIYARMGARLSPAAAACMRRWLSEEARASSDRTESFSRIKMLGKTTN